MLMKILGRYIARTTMGATSIAALIIIGILFLMMLLGELKTIGEGDYNIV
ncbi:MAG: LPS export ABC transporter permease LptG, partial [Gammaproteobacteria bacterium]|nr:LPS export ABC transporter permease LptG [Gammaproteobacteria bacterium]